MNFFKKLSNPKPQQIILKNGYFKPIAVTDKFEPFLAKFKLTNLSPLFQHKPNSTQFLNVNESTFMLNYIGDKSLNLSNAVYCDAETISKLVSLINKENHLLLVEKAKKDLSKLSSEDLLNKAANMFVELEKLRLEDFDDD